MKHKQNWLIVPDAIPMLTLFSVLTVIGYLVGRLWLALIPFLLVIFTLFFFRNPRRKASVRKGDIVAPADGLILAVEEVEENTYLHSPAIKISIFLNIFNVHVNRVPVAGEIEYICYRPGKFLPAFKTHASEINERNYVGIRCADNPNLAVLVVQITGFIARRIVCWVEKGDKLEQGDLFGMIKFGSCTELYIPINSTVFVKKGQKVRGGETIIGRLHNE